MSVRWITWAWEQKCENPGEKLTLIALADHAGEDGTAFPSAGRIGDKTGQSNATVRRHLDALDARGLLTRTRRRRQNGTLGTYTYTLVATTAHSDQWSTSPHGDDDADHRSPTSGRPPLTHERAEPSGSEPSVEPSVCDRRNVDRQRFVEFWAMYPRRVGKANARKAWEKIVTAKRVADRATPDEILAGLHARVEWWKRDGTAKGLIPHPATWLNGRRWEDEIEPLDVKRRRAAAATQAADHADRAGDEYRDALDAGDGARAWSIVVERAAATDGTEWWPRAAGMLDSAPDHVIARVVDVDVEHIIELRELRDRHLTERRMLRESDGHEDDDGSDP